MQLNETFSTLAAIAALALDPAAHAGDFKIADYPISECGVLMLDYYYGCTVFVPLDGYETYLLDSAGGFNIGDQVHLSGIATLDCVSPCNFDACVFDATLAPCGAMPGDLDGDGVVGPADLAILLTAWGECPGKAACPADLSGDGAVGPADLAVLLTNWTS